MRKMNGKTGKNLTLLASVLLLLAVTVGGTLAYLMDSDGPINNLFTPSRVTTDVEETLEGNVKSQVKIKNTGNTTAWLRADVRITWQNAQGNVYGQLPVKDQDYTITYDLANGWLEGNDGYYYWNTPVNPDALSGVLITSCAPKDSAKAPDGYHLAVEICGSGIQDYPNGAFAQWAPNSGITIQNGKLVKG